MLPFATAAAAAAATARRQQQTTTSAFTTLFPIRPPPPPSGMTKKRVLGSHTHLTSKSFLGVPYSNTGRWEARRSYVTLLPRIPLDYLSAVVQQSTQYDDNDDGVGGGGGGGHSSSSDHTTKRHIQSEMERLHLNMKQLNDGIEINMNSPKQVANAIFGGDGDDGGGSNNSGVDGSGRSSTTSREVLQSIVDGDTTTKGDDRKREMARLVLRYRSLNSRLRRENNGGGGSTTTVMGDGIEIVSKKRNGAAVVAKARTFSTMTEDGRRDGSKKKKGRESPMYGDEKSSSEASGKTLLSGQQRFSSSTQSTYADVVNSLFGPKSQIDDYWSDTLHRIIKPSARSMISQLDPYLCPMGYDPNASPLLLLTTGGGLGLTLVSSDGNNNNGNDNNNNRGSSTSSSSSSTAGKRGSLLAYVRDQKLKYGDCVVLTRVGEFYEAFGLDAALLVEFCGLNPMAGKARAGCPLKNIQQTLNCLTINGFRVAIYEEAPDTDSMIFGPTYTTKGGGGGGASKKSRLKTRMLAQVVSSASPTYLYDLVLEGGGGGNGGTLLSTGSCPPSRPHVGIISNSAGYTIVEVSIEERNVRIQERLTCEAVACRLAAYPPADPLFYVPAPGEEESTSSSRLPFLPSRSDVTNEGAGSRLRTKILSPTFMEDPKPGVTDLERARKVIVSALLQMTEFRDYGHDDPYYNNDGLDINNSQRREGRIISHEDFVLVSSSSRNGVTTYDDSVDSSSLDDNVLLQSTKREQQPTHAQPLYVETATQLGLMSDPTIPSLVSHLLPNTAPPPTKRLLRRWLLTPPPAHVADAMSQLVTTLKDDEDGLALPPLSVPPLGKVLALIRAGQASAEVYGEVLCAMDATVSVLDSYHDHDDHEEENDKDAINNIIIEPLMVLLQHESGLAANPQTLKRRCLETMNVIENVVSVHHHVRHSHRPSEDVDDNGSSSHYIIDRISDCGNIIPRAFFERNEGPWRGRIRPEVAVSAYGNVDLAARELAKAVSIDFWGQDGGMIDVSSKEVKSPVVQDIFNNLIALKEVPLWSKERTTATNNKNDESSSSGTKSNQKYFHPRDRNGKILRNRYTTTNVQDALSNYVDACDDARLAVTSILTQLSETLCDDTTGYLVSIVQASHANLILSTAIHHAGNSNALGWNMATLYDDYDYDYYDNNGNPGTSKAATIIGERKEIQEQGRDFEIQASTEDDDDNISAGHFVNVWPYWMDRTEAVSNTFHLNGMFLLTAPNMSGKSTLMRSTAAAALLTNCGLCAPLSPSSSVRRFDTIFVRGASSDIPNESKSAFGGEMTDVAALLRCCGQKSLVFVDELGRGTSPKDGTTLAGAVLESMAECGMSGMFATHLHGVLDLPLNKEAWSRIVRKRMAIRAEHHNNKQRSLEEEEEEFEWTYKLEDGVCTDSMALVTAARFGLPEKVLKRAKALSLHVDDGLLINHNGIMGSAAATAAVDMDVRSKSGTTRDGKQQPDYESVLEDRSTADHHHHPSVDFQRVTKIIEETMCNDDSKPIHIPPKWMAPPSLEGRSCVYILEVGGGGGNSPTKTATTTDMLLSRRPQPRSPRYYVGETDSLSQRLRQHRAKGKEWSNLRALAVKVKSGGKTEARNVESLIIRRMAKAGFDMISVADGRTVRRRSGDTK